MDVHYYINELFRWCQFVVKSQVIIFHLWFLPQTGGENNCRNLVLLNIRLGGKYIIEVEDLKNIFLLFEKLINLKFNYIYKYTNI